MIPILYNANETSFTTFGVGVLSEASSCLVTEERNGPYELVLKYPVKGILFNEIKKNMIIKAKPNDLSQPQAFRIYRITVPINGEVSIYAQHISYDLAFVGVKPFSLTNVNPGTVMTQVFYRATQNTNFSFSTDYTNTKDFSLKTPESIRACLGGIEGSILNQWGGEFEWDNFHIIHHQHRGNDNGVYIEYGKNLTKLDHDSNISDVYTDLMPYAVNTDDEGNETTVTLTEGTLPFTSELSTSKTLIKNFTDYFDDDTYITEALLRSVAQDFITSNPLGIETPAVRISFEALWKLPEYSALLERVSLCDTVTVRHSLLGITIKTKVITTVYEAITEKYTTISLGSPKSNLVDQVASIGKEVEETQEAVSPSAMEKAVSNATKKITGNMGGYVILHADSTTGKPYELLIMDSPSIDDAVNVWRWNVNGLGFSSTGYNGPYGTAITADGSIVADFITAGTIDAAYIDCEGVIDAAQASIKELTTDQLEAGDVTVKGEIYAQSGVFEGDLTVTSNTTSEIKNLQVENLLADEINAEETETYDLLVNHTATVQKLEIASVTLEEVNSTQPAVTTRYFDCDGSCFLNNQFFFFTGRVTVWEDSAHTVYGVVPKSTTLTVTINATIVDDHGTSILSKDVNVALTSNAHSASSSAKLISVFDNPVVSGVHESLNIYQKNYDTVAGTIGLGVDSDFLPKDDNTDLLGDANHRWKDVYSVNSQCNTSDRRIKKDINYDLKNYDALFDELKPVSFKFIDGESGRTHLGFISQDIKDSLDKCGISPVDFACYVKSLKRDSQNKDNPTEDDYVYGIRYGELHALEVYEIKLLKDYIKKLEARIKSLEEES